MKVKKKILLYEVVAVVMLIASLTSVYAAQHAMPENTDNIDKISVGETKDIKVTSKDENMTFRFVAEEKGIEYHQQAVPELIHMLDGWWRNDYFYHNLRNCFPASGDKLTVIREDGSSSRYTYDSDSKVFVCDDDIEDLISKWDIEYEGVDNMDWTVGEHRVIVTYNGFTTNASVNVVKNNVKTISYTPMRGIPEIEDTSGWLEEDAGGD